MPLNGALAALSLPDVTVTARLPVVPVEQLRVALIDMTVDFAALALSGGVNFTFPTAEHITVPIASKGGALAVATEGPIPTQPSDTTNIVRTKS